MTPAREERADWGGNFGRALVRLIPSPHSSRTRAPFFSIYSKGNGRWAKQEAGGEKNEEFLPLSFLLHTPIGNYDDVGGGGEDSRRMGRGWIR